MAGAGKRAGGFTYVHREAVPLLPQGERRLLDDFLADGGASAEWNVAKIGKAGVSLLLYEDFELSAFPALLKATSRDKTGRLASTDYSGRANPPILHRKELLLPPDDHRLPAFRAVTLLAEEAGLFADVKRIGTRRVWNELVEAAGLRIEGPRLLRREEGRVDVLRGKTAIRRPGLSSPVSAMLDLGMIRPGDSVFDFGCGHGGDVDILRENGFDAFGWDPVHRPDGPRMAADIVNLGFVLNVIEDPRERAEALKAAWSFARKGMAVAIIRHPPPENAGHRPLGDGRLTSRRTFQKHFSHGEILDYVSSVLGHRTITIENGVAAVFRDEEREQEVVFARRSRSRLLRASLAMRLPERPPREGPRGREVPAEAVAGIWEAALDLGRMPAAEEAGENVLRALAESRTSFRRAVEHCAATYDLPSLEAMARARKEDLVVLGALSLFPGAQKYSSLPARIKRDVRHFFGNHASFVDASLRALGELRDAAAVMRGFEESAGSGFASLSDGVLSFPVSHGNDLAVPARIMLGCADILSPGFSSCDAVDMRLSPPRLIGYSCPDFPSPLPRISEIRRVELDRLHASSVHPTDAILYGKSRFMTKDEAGRGRQSEIDGKLVRAGIVSQDHRGPRGRDLARLLKSRDTSA